MADYYIKLPKSGPTPGGPIVTDSLTITSMDEGSVLFAGPGGLVSQNNANFFWDNIGNRLSIGSNTPGAVLDVSGQNPNNYARFLSSDSSTGYNTFSVSLTDNSVDDLGTIQFLGNPEDGFFTYADNGAIGDKSNVLQTATSIQYIFDNDSASPVLSMNKLGVQVNGNNPLYLFQVLGQDAISNFTFGGDSTTGYNNFQLYLKDYGPDDFGVVECGANPEEGVFITCANSDNTRNGSVVQNTGAYQVTVNDPTTSARFTMSTVAAAFSGTPLWWEGDIGPTPISGAGTRLMWVPSKQAFRAGTVDGTQWDEANIGANSFAFGNNNTSSIPFTFTMGDSNMVGDIPNDSGYFGVAFGSNNVVKSDGGITFGNANFIGWDGVTASGGGVRSFATGENNVVDGNYSFVSGSSNSTALGAENSAIFGSSNSVDSGTGFIFGAGNASNGQTFTIGINNVNSSSGFSTVIGSDNSTDGNRNVIIGINNSTPSPTEDSYTIGNNNNTTGYNSVAIGSFLSSKAFTGVVVGNANDNTDTPVVNNPNTTDRIFQIGNGGYEAATRSNAMTVLRNGNVGIGTLVPNNAAILDVASTTKGILLPRMTTTQVNAIGSPPAGLTVYNTTLACICFYDGTGWRKVSHSAM